MKIFKRLFSILLAIAIVSGILVIIGAPQTAQAAGSTYYVSTTGDDTTGDGTQAKPWKTIGKALSTVPAGKGHTISVAAGSYNEERLVVPEGTSLIGTGSSDTIIYCTKYDELSYAVTAMGGNQTIKGFKLDGNNAKVNAGLRVINASNVIVDDVRVERMRYVGIALFSCTNVEVKNCVTVDTSWGSYDYCSGAIVFQEVTDCSFHDNTISEYPFQEGDTKGYGFKHVPSGTVKVHVTNVKIYNNVVNVAPDGEWHNIGNFALELWGAKSENIDIFNNTFNQCLSMVTGLYEPNRPTRIYNNTIAMTKRGFAIELETRAMEIYNNFITHDYSPNYILANWAGEGSVNQKIHHNVFENPAGQIFRFERGNADNLEFYNNTVYTDKKLEGIFINNGKYLENGDIYFKNNIFYSTTANNRLIGIGPGVKVANFVAQNNCLFNFKEGDIAGNYANNLINTDPQLVLSGDKPYPYYMPKQGSPVIDAGIDVGFSYVGSAPDIGAYEYGTTPKPVEIPTSKPTATPTPKPTATPTPEPTATPTPEPTVMPAPKPTATPAPEPTATPTPEPTAEPTTESTSTPVPSTPEPSLKSEPTDESEPALETSEEVSRDKTPNFAVVAVIAAVVILAGIIIALIVRSKAAGRK